MPYHLERETKIAVAPEEARAALREAAAQLQAERHLEENWVLDHPDGRLQREDRLLRLRRMGGAGGKWLLTLKGPGWEEGGHKVREESETRVGEGELLLEAFATAGLEVAWRYEKYRTTWELAGVTVSLDETPIGAFLELEGEAGATEEAARLLELDAEKFVDRTYADLWRERGETGFLLFERDEP